MGKFKIEKGASRIARVKLQATIDESIAADLSLMCEWSNNDKNYVVNELLRFAVSEDSEFQAQAIELAIRALYAGSAAIDRQFGRTAAKARAQVIQGPWAAGTN